MYGTDGAEGPATGEGFQVFSVFSDVTADPLDHLNPHTQETVLRDPVAGIVRKPAQRYRTLTRGKAARAKAKLRAVRASARSPAAGHLAP